MSDSNLITPYSFQGHPYLIKINSTTTALELLLVDKNSGEEWECSYDTMYIENLTRKTGNFKQFEIFVSMLKSGLLKTSDCITLDLLTYEDLEALRVRKVRNYSSRNLASNNNRRYLIITYTVEFDKINYPLPLEYCGPPDPTILQATIQRLEAELSKAYEKLESKNNSHERHQIRLLQKRVDELVAENLHLREEVKILARPDKKSKGQVETLQKAIEQLEKNVKFERSSHHKLVEKLQSDKTHLNSQLEKVKSNEKILRTKLHAVSSKPHIHEAKYKNNGTSKLHRDAALHLQGKLSFPRPAKHTYPNQRSRSASPRITQNDHWEGRHNARNLSGRSKSRSRSSSVSSSKHSERQFALETLNSPRCSRKQSPYLSSASAASLSNGSGDAGGRRNASPAHSQSASVKQLELRVRKLFQNNSYKKF